MSYGEPTVLRPGLGQNVTVSGTSAVSTAVGTSTEYVQLALTGATAKAAVRFGKNTPVAVTTDMTVVNNTPATYKINPGEKVAVVGTDGTLNVCEMTK